MYLTTGTFALLAVIVTVSSYDYGTVEQPSPVSTGDGYGGGSRVVNPGYGARPSRVDTGYTGRQRGYGSGGLHGPAFPARK